MRLPDLFLDGKLLEILALREGRRIAFRAAAVGLRCACGAGQPPYRQQCGDSGHGLADNSAAVIVGEPTAGMLFGKDFETLKDGRALWIRIAP